MLIWRVCFYLVIEGHKFGQTLGNMHTRVHIYCIYHGLRGSQGLWLVESCQSVTICKHLFQIKGHIG